MQRRLLMAIVNAFKWLAQSFTNLYNSLIPTTISGKSVKNKAKISKVYGNSVVENQLLPISTANDKSSHGITFTNNRDGSWSVSGTADDNAYAIILSNIKVDSSHKYLLKGCPSGGGNSTFYLALNYNAQYYHLDTGNGIIFNVPSGVSSVSIAIRVFNGTALTTAKDFLPNLIDLTQMFPFDTPTSLTDVRVQALLNRDIEYNTGELKSVDISEFSTTKADTTALATLPFIYQGSGAGTSHDTFEITSSEYVFTKNMVDVDFSTMGTWTYDSSHTRFYSAEINSKYQVPADNNTKANILCNKYQTLEQQVLFEGTQDKAISYSSSGCVSIRDTSLNGDTSLISGSALMQLATPQVITIPKKHLGIVNLGSLEYVYSTATQRFSVSMSSLNLKPTANNESVGNIYCDKFISVSYSDSANHTKDLSIAIDRVAYLYIYSTEFIGKTASEVKTLLSGTYLFYETESEVADIETQIVIEAGGTITSDSEVLPNVEFSVKCK